MSDGTGVFAGVLVCLGLYLIGASVLAYSTHAVESVGRELRLFGIALGVRFMMSMILYNSNAFLNVLGDEDSSGWGAGWGLFMKWTQQHVSVMELPGILLEAFEGHHRGYAYLNGLLFFLIGTPSRLAAAALNCFFGAVTVVLVSRVAGDLFGERVAAKVGWLTCFFPSLVVWSSQTLKEPVVIFLETLCFYSATRIKSLGFSPVYIGIALGSVIGLFPFRFYAVYVSCLAMVLALILPEQGFYSKRFVPALAIGLGFLVIVTTSVGIMKETEHNLNKYDIETIQSFKQNVATGEGSRSGVEQNFNLNTPGGFSAAVVVGALHLLFAPFPWQWGGASLRMLGVVPETVVWWWLCKTALWPGLVYAIRRRFNAVLPLLVFLFCMGMLYSVMFGNVGLIYRQRAQLLPWLLLFVAVGLELKAISRNANAINVAPIPSAAAPERPARAS